MAQSKDKTVQIVCWIVAAPIAKGAFLAQFQDEHGDEIGTRWLPYSRVWKDDGKSVKGTEKGEMITIELPLWLAEKPDIERLIRNQVLEMEGGMQGADEREEEDAFDEDIPF